MRLLSDLLPGRPGPHPNAIRTAYLGDHGWFAYSREEYLTRACLAFTLLALPAMSIAQYAPSMLLPLLGVLMLPLLPWATWRIASLPRLAYLPFFALAILACASTVWSAYPARTGRGGLVLLSYLLMGLVLAGAAARLSERSRKRIAVGLAWGCVLCILLYLPQQAWLSWRFPNITAPDIWRLHKISIYALFAGVMLIHLVRQRHASGWLLLAPAALVIAIQFTHSDGSRILLALLAVVLFAPERIATSVFAGALAVFTALTALLPLIARPAFVFLDSAGLLAWKSLTLGARLELWSAISGTFAERPWLGHGANTLQMRAELIGPSFRYYMLPEMIGAHNNSVEMWYDLGLVGVAAYVACFLTAGVLAWRLRGLARRTSMALILCVLIPLCVDHRLWLSWLLGYIGLVAIAAAFLTQMREHTDIDARPRCLVSQAKGSPGHPPDWRRDAP